MTRPGWTIRNDAWSEEAEYWESDVWAIRKRYKSEIHSTRVTDLIGRSGVRRNGFSREDYGGQNRVLRSLVRPTGRRPKGVRGESSLLKDTKRVTHIWSSRNKCPQRNE